MSDQPEAARTTCCIVGGGPAGMMLGYLLARAGVQALVLEKHEDFLRDFRGDTIHPSTLEVLHELGILGEFLDLPHQKVPIAHAQFGDLRFTAIDFSTLPTHCKFIALIPQWDFLDFLACKASNHPGFSLRMATEATALITEGGRVTGVRAMTPDGPIDIEADLVVGCDGRHSTMREEAGLQVLDQGAPMDVLWFRMTRRAEDENPALGNFDHGLGLILIPRGDYFQCGMVIAKGSFPEIQRRGLEDFRRRLTALAPFARSRLTDLNDWKQVKMLSVRVDRLQRWHRPGLLCIGDAAHAMSPVGGVGINLAIQDAVAAANILADPLIRGGVTEELLDRVRRRRELPTRLTQGFQGLIHRFLARHLGRPERMDLPRLARFWLRTPLPRRLNARVIGVGFRPEHVETPIVPARAAN